MISSKIQKKNKKIHDFLRSIKCFGGDDYCQDVKGGRE